MQSHVEIELSRVDFLNESAICTRYVWDTDGTAAARRRLFICVRVNRLEKERQQLLSTLTLDKTLILRVKSQRIDTHTLCGLALSVGEGKTHGRLFGLILQLVKVVAASSPPTRND